jgi:protein phosphatase PTC7
MWETPRLDSVWPSGETDRLLELVRSRVDAGGDDKELAASIAQTAVTFARMIAVRPDVYTPFAAESKRWQVKGMERGGKVDDVTVVVAVVRKE